MIDLNEELRKRGIHPVRTAILYAQMYGAVSIADFLGDVHNIPPYKPRTIGDFLHKNPEIKLFNRVQFESLGPRSAIISDSTGTVPIHTYGLKKDRQLHKSSPIMIFTSEYIFDRKTKQLTLVRYATHGQPQTQRAGFGVPSYDLS